MNDTVKLYRKRYMPDENIWLKDDELLYIDDDIIVTKWKTLKPRRDFDHGCSCVYIKKGIKVSKFYNAENKFLYDYCDIIETQYDEKENAYIFKDLLIDVIVHENGFVKIVDVCEIVEALDKGIITLDQAKLALTVLDRLLNIIYEDGFEELTLPLKDIYK